jgi:hypothetical protein
MSEQRSIPLSIAGQDLALARGLLRESYPRRHP